MNILYNSAGEWLNITADVETDYLGLGEAYTDVNDGYAANAFMGIVMLDNNYKYFSPSNIKLIIDAMGASGLNYLMLGFGGSGRGLGFALDDMNVTVNGVDYDISEYITTNFGAYLTESDMTDIIAYGRQNGVEIIPYLNMPGHFRPFLTHHPEFRYNNDADSLDINNSVAVEYAVEIAKMFMRYFASQNVQYWMVGADEFAHIVTGYYDLYSSGNYRYADFLNRVAYEAAKLRMIPMFYNDPICIDGDRQPYINRKSPVLYWGKEGTHWATASTIADDGHKIINSSRNIYWVANGPQVTESNIRNFNIKKLADGSTMQTNPAGACFCIWIGTRENPALDDDGDAITESVLPLITAFGETVSSQVE